MLGVVTHHRQATCHRLRAAIYLSNTSAVDSQTRGEEEEEKGGVTGDQRPDLLQAKSPVRRRSNNNSSSVVHCSPLLPVEDTSFPTAPLCCSVLPYPPLEEEEEEGECGPLLPPAACRGWKELKDVLTNVPEIAALVGHEEIAKVLGVKEHDESDKAVLQSVFTKLMSASKEVISDLVSKLKSRLNTESKVRALTEKERLVLVLENQYPADVGVLSSFFLNYVKLSPGEALYLGANEPHAYLSGECIECMAASDNVVRAGLTPKYRDVQTLCSMLTYKQGFPEILQGIPLDTHISRYIPPFEEFEVDHCSLPSEKSLVLPAIPGPSLLIVVAGEGTMQVTSSVGEDKIMEGHIFFVPAGIEISLSAGSAGALQLYRAGVNSRFLE